MFKSNARKLSLMVMLLLVAGVSQVSALIVEQPGYIVEEFVSYDHPGLLGPTGYVHDMVFDNEGNLYVSNGGSSSTVSDGSIYKITSTGDVSLFMSGFTTPYKMDFGGGTAYGNNLFTADVNNRTLIQMDTQANSAVLSSSNYRMVGIEIDRTGYYGNQLYTGGADYDKVFSVGIDGTVQEYKDLSNIMSGTIDDIAIDSTGRYGNLMFVSTYSGNWDSGIYMIDHEGNASRFATGDFKAGTMEFDTVGLFDNNMFVYGFDQSEIRTIYQVSPTGDIEAFLTSNSERLNGIAFGADGAMYVHEMIDHYSSKISRITPVPEPAMIALMGMGLTVLRRRKRA